ncbi:MAG: hypothetical protein Q9196_004244 [Gyalolechia fulgens]
MEHTHGNDAKFHSQDYPINGNGVDPSDDVLKNTRQRLMELATLNDDDKTFISLPLIQTYWKEHPLDEFLKEFFPFITKDTLDTIRTTSLRILTAVVITEWRDSAVRNFRTTFEKMFLDKAGAPWNDELLLGEGGLPRLDLSLPLEERNRLDRVIPWVSVPVLQKSKERRYSSKITLPITKRDPKPLGTGAHGQVHKAEEFFAWKKMNSVVDGQRELAFARDYAKSTTTSVYILDYLTIIERGTDEASILYPLGQGDLRQLLSGKIQCEEWPEDDPERLRKVIRKCYDLADGLEFLHNQVRNEGACFCRHGDIKPDNFLIFGKDWKMADMGLARVKKFSNDEHGVRITTKTLPQGTNSYSAPEMGPGNATVGRSTDVWGLAAIIMEVIIWGLGGPPARKEFEERRNECSEGLFYKNNVLSKAVDDELHSWSTKYSEKVIEYLHGDKNLAEQILTGLVSALRKALSIKVEDRSKSSDLMRDLKAVENRYSMPRGYKPQEQSLKRLNISEAPTAGTYEMMKRRADEHFKHEFFDNIEPNSRIGVSAETEYEIKQWIIRPTDAAIAILSNDETKRLHLSAITHEVYFTARLHRIEVVKFFTLDRDLPRTESLEPSLDLVYCFIYQFMNFWKVDPEKYPLDRRAISNSTLSNEMKFKNAVSFLGCLIQEHGQHPNQQPLIVFIDEFWRVCPREASQVVREQWSLLLKALGCTQTQGPRLKVLIRIGAYLESLRDLGFTGLTCIPPRPKQGGTELRKQVYGWLDMIAY